MTIAKESAFSSRKPDRKAWPPRARLLTLLAAVVGIASGIIAIVLDGTLRTSFAAASIVCLAAATYCITTVWLDTSYGPPVDLEAPTPEPPVSQSYVTLVHDPGQPQGGSSETETFKASKPS